MKPQIALLGCLMLVSHGAMANIDCARAPYGESISRYGRDEFQLGVLAVKRDGGKPSIPQDTMHRIEKEMSAACLAKIYGENLPRYVRLGLSPHALASESVGTIAAVALAWSGPQPGTNPGVAPQPAVSGAAPPMKPPAASGEPGDASPATQMHYVRVTSNFAACPRKVDLERLLSAALIDSAEWPQAEAAGKRHGCIQLHAGDRVDRLATDRWGGMTQVRPEGQTAAYWTDTMVVR